MTTRLCECGSFSCALVARYRACGGPIDRGTSNRCATPRHAAAGLNPVSIAQMAFLPRWSAHGPSQQKARYAANRPGDQLVEPSLPPPRASAQHATRIWLPNPRRRCRRGARSAITADPAPNARNAGPSARFVSVLGPRRHFQLGRHSITTSASRRWCSLTASAVSSPRAAWRMSDNAIRPRPNPWQYIRYCYGARLRTDPGLGAQRCWPARVRPIG